MGKRFTACVVLATLLVLSVPALAAYRAELRLASHNGRLFNFETWDAEIIWHATFFSDNFRRAFKERHISINHLDDAEADSFLADEARRQARGWDFFIVMYAKKEYKPFTIETDSFWKMRLTTSSGEIVKPESVDAIPNSPYVKAMYSHLNRWSKCYRVTFPKVDLGDSFELTMESVVGASTLKWRVR